MKSWGQTLRVQTPSRPERKPARSAAYVEAD
jgi:hypothetical protein